jgi:hypothetical protein
MIKSEVIMKTKKNMKKLALNKISIARLSDDTMNQIKAGDTKWFNSGLLTETCPRTSNDPFFGGCTIRTTIIPPDE